MTEIKNRCNYYWKKRYCLGAKVSMTERIGEVEITLQARSVKELLKLSDELVMRTEKVNEHSI